MVVPLAVPRPAHAADAGLVIEAFNVLREYYVDRVDAAAMLNGALAGVRSALSNAGVQGEVAEIPAGTSGAQSETVFRTRFDAAVAAAGGRIAPTVLADTATRAMTAQLKDSHTWFLTPEENRERVLRQQRQAGFSGAGIVLMLREGKYYIRDVIPGSPAASGGVQQFDRIVRVDNVPTAGLQPDQLSGLIRGQTGTSVSLVLERPGRADPVTVSLTRAPIQVPAVFQARVLENGIGYLQFYQFVSRSSAEFRGALNGLLGNGMRALVLDLRGNLGGFVNELEAIVSLFLPPGQPIYQEVARGGQTRAVRTFGVPLLPGHQPVIILVDESSASAAELLAAALQEHGRATVVGQKTMGAVEAAIMIDLSDGSGLSVTVRRLASAQGRRLEGAGVAPDVAVDLPVIELDQGRDSQLQVALQLARQRLGTAEVPAVPAGR
jgi:carboxyl-terminal processing protease